MGAESQTTPTLASLQQARARQRQTVRWLRPLGAVVVAAILAAGLSETPKPGLAGDGRWVLLGLVAFVGCTVALVAGRKAPPGVQAPLVAGMIAGSGVLAWFHPNGPYLLGVYVAVIVAAMRVQGRVAAATVALALLAGALAAATAHRPAATIVLNEFGIASVYLVAASIRRLRESQLQAERLLAELEQTRAAQVRAAALSERQRLAREMHDVLAHSLSALLLQLEGARLLAANTADAELTDALERSHHLAKSGLEEARRAIGTLRDEELPGPQRLEALVDEFEHDCGVSCELRVAGDKRSLDFEARLALYRTAQEALTNIRKHARPDRVELELEYESQGTRLTIEDLGATPARPTRNGAGYGLTGMRERAELLGGTLSAAPTATGFRVELWVPA